MPTPLARMFGRGRSRPQRGGDLGHGLRLAAALVESDQPLRVLTSACRLAVRVKKCDVALIGLETDRDAGEGNPIWDWTAGGCRRIDRRMLEEALNGRHSPLMSLGDQPLWIRMGDDPFQPGTPVLRRFELAWFLTLPGRISVEGEPRRGVMVIGGRDPQVEQDHPLIRDARLIWLATQQHLSTAADRALERTSSPWPQSSDAWHDAPASLALVDGDRVAAINTSARKLLAECVGSDEARWHGWLLGAVRRLDVCGRTSEVLTASSRRDQRLEVTVGRSVSGHGLRLIALNRVATPAVDTRDQESAMRMLGHELRTPLTAMQTSLDLVLRGDAGQMSGDQRRFIGTTRRNLDRLGRLLADLLDARHSLTVGSPVIEPQTVDLGALLHDELSILEVVCREKGIALETDGVPRSFRACIDQDKVQQMLHNIVGNAIKYTADGGVVRVALEDRPERAPDLGPRLAWDYDLPLDVFTLVVQDTGLGMSEAFLATLFEPFNREDRAELRGLPGAGLGLHITRGLVEAHGGLIRITSKPGQGTTVRLALPREQESGRVLTAGRQLAALHARAVAAQLPVVLCVLDLRAGLAGSQPWEVEAAGEQALAFLSRLGRQSSRDDTAGFARSAGALGWPLAPGLCCGLALDPPRLAAAWEVAAAAPESVRGIAGSRWIVRQDLLENPVAHPERWLPPQPEFSTLPLDPGWAPERVGV
jgi:signal transduction histidine kinase